MHDCTYRGARCLCLLRLERWRRTASSLSCDPPSRPWLCRRDFGRARLILPHAQSISLALMRKRSRRSVLYSCTAVKCHTQLSKLIIHVVRHLLLLTRSSSQGSSAPSSPRIFVRVTVRRAPRCAARPARDAAAVCRAARPAPPCPRRRVALCQPRFVRASELLCERARERIEVPLRAL